MVRTPTNLICLTQCNPSMQGWRGEVCSLSPGEHRSTRPCEAEGLINQRVAEGFAPWMRNLVGPGGSCLPVSSSPDSPAARGSGFKTRQAQVQILLGGRWWFLTWGWTVIRA